MSIYYTPELVKLVMEERLREARQSNVAHCCEELAAEEPRTSLADHLRSMFRNPSPTACEC
ncbi:MAG: hypothetical protein ABSB75_00860 [Candidatus Limnocylindrales bacterium]